MAAPCAGASLLCTCERRGARAAAGGAQLVERARAVYLGAVDPAYRRCAVLDASVLRCAALQPRQRGVPRTGKRHLAWKRSLLRSPGELQVRAAGHACDRLTAPGGDSQNRLARVQLPAWRASSARAARGAGSRAR